MTKHLRNALLVSALLVPFAGVPHAQALPVLFGSDAATIEPGQTVTVEGSVLQLEAPDGSIISFAEGSTFTITGEGDSLSFNLVSGSMRVASAGMPISVTRGGVTVSSTGGAFSAFASDSGGLDGRVNEGTANVSNGGETREFARGDGYEASDTDVAGTFTPPVPTTTQVASNNSGDDDTDYSPADEQGSGGGSSVAEEAGGGAGGGTSYGGTPPVTGVVNPVTGTEDTGYSIAYAGDAIGIDTRTDVTVTVGSGGELNRYKVGDGSSEDLERNSNSSLERGNAGNAIFVERWAGGETHGNYYNSYNGTTYSSLARTSYQGFHLAYGQPATNLPTQGVALYSLAAATSPTIDDGSFAPGTFTGTLGIAFGPAFKVGVDFSVDMPGDHTYSIKTSGGSATPSGAVNYTDLANGVFVLDPVSMAQAGAACPSANCKAFVDGILGGTTGDYVGIAYNIYDSSVTTDSTFRGKRISGAAAFSQDSYDAGGSGGSGGGTIGSADPQASGSLDAQIIDVGSNRLNVYLVPVSSGSNAIYGDKKYVFDRRGALLSFTDFTASGDTAYTRDTAVVGELAGTEYIQIGRWNGGDIQLTGGKTGTVSPTGNEGLTYLFATAADTLVPTSGSAHYALKAATRPIYKSGIGYTGSFNGALGIQFGSTPLVGVNAVVTMNEPGGDAVYDFSTAGGAGDPSNGGITLTNGSFTNSYVQMSFPGLACGGSCYVSYGGFIRGPGSRDAGLSYNIGTGSEQLYGAAFFQRDDDPSLLLQTSNLNALYASPGTLVITNGIGSGAYSSSALVTFDSGGDITGFADQNYANIAIDNGAATIADAGSAGSLSWARWTGGALGGTAYSSPAPTMPTDGGIHIVVGPSATNIPVSGTAQYGLTGATKPTIADGSVSPGTFTGTLGVDFANAKVGIDFNVSIGGHDYAFASAGGSADPSQSSMGLYGAYFGSNFGHASGATFDATTGGPACPSTSCKATVSGFLSGNGASHAAVNYTISQYGSPNNAGAVQGVAVFSQTP